MLRIRVVAMVLGLALALAACSAAVPDTSSPSASAIASPAAAVSTAQTMPAPSSAPTSVPPPSAADSLEPGAAKQVLDAALATQNEDTLRFAVDVRSADPDDGTPAVTGTGQVSFAAPTQFRFASPGVNGTVPASEVIYDGEHLFSRGRDTPYLPEDTWVVLDIKPGTMGQELLVRQYGNYTLVLVAPLGVTSAEASGQETIDGRAVTRYVTQVDVESARPRLPESLLPAFESHVNTFNSAGIPLTHEVEVWVGADGRVARTRYVQELEGQDVDALVYTYDFEDYGAPMDVAPPDGATVLTIDEVREYRASPESPSPAP
jgi:hypothetical protein